MFGRIYQWIYLVDNRPIQMIYFTFVDLVICVYQIIESSWIWGHKVSQNISLLFLFKKYLVYLFGCTGSCSCSMWALSCGTWELVPWPGIEPRTPALEAQSLSQRITRDVAGGYFAMPSCFIHVWLFAILWTAARQTPLSMGFSRWE